MKLKTLIMLFVFGSINSWAEKDVRSRAESIPGIMSSNTIGVGNIWFVGDVSSFMQTTQIHSTYLQSLVDDIYLSSLQSQYNVQDSKMKKEVLIVPRAGVGFGLTEFMHLEGISNPWNGNKIGVTTTKLKVTLPNTGKLRMYGIGFSSNLTLSTEENTVLVQEETPAFDPIIWFTGAFDIDMIKSNPKIPWKLYLNMSNLNNYRFYQQYQQYDTKIGIELKKEKSSTYIKGGGAIYMQKKDAFNANAIDKKMKMVWEVGFGYRKRFASKFPFSIGLDMEMNPLNPVGFINDDLSKPLVAKIYLEIGLYTKKTKSETIRSLIFEENKRKKRGINKDEKEKKKKSLNLKELMNENDEFEKNKSNNDNKLIKKLMNKEEERKRKKIYQDLNTKQKNGKKSAKK